MIGGVEGAKWSVYPAGAGMGVEKNTPPMAPHKDYLFGCSMGSDSTKDLAYVTGFNISCFQGNGACYHMGGPPPTEGNYELNRPYGVPVLPPQPTTTPPMMPPPAPPARKYVANGAKPLFGKLDNVSPALIASGSVVMLACFLVTLRKAWQPKAATMEAGSTSESTQDMIEEEVQLLSTI